MGVNLNLYLIKDSSQEKKLDLELILDKLGVESKLEQKGLTYEQLLNELWNRKSTPLIGVSYYNNHFIIQDDYLLINHPFEAFTRDLQTAVLAVSNSDTVEVSGFSYYDKGQCVRSKTYGNNDWVQDMQDLDIELPEGVELGDLGDVDKGEPLEFEKNGSVPFAVMETYGIAFKKLYELEWEVRVIKE